MIFFRKRKRTESTWREEPNPQRWGVADTVNATDETSGPGEDIENEELAATPPERLASTGESSGPIEDVENEDREATPLERLASTDQSSGPIEDVENEDREASLLEALEYADTMTEEHYAAAAPAEEPDPFGAEAGYEDPAVDGPVEDADTGAQEDLAEAAPAEEPEAFRVEAGYETPSVEGPVEHAEPRDDAAETAQEPVSDDASVPAARAPIRRPHVIVVANEKGGCGKSTLAMHIALYLMDRGKSVGTIDLDGRQGTLTRMFNNRRRYAILNDVDLPVPEHLCMCPPEESSSTEQAREDLAVLQGDLQKLASQEFIVIDTPGTDAYLSRFAHSVASTLITPVNDSFIDLDVLGHIEPDTGRVDGPSPYAELVLEEMQRRQQEADRPLDWIVTRNRLSNLYAHNKKEVSDGLDKLSAYLGFRQAPGFSERVIFRELFPKGLTLLDLRRKDLGFNWTLSHISAREELRQLIAAAGLSKIVDDEREHEPSERPIAAETTEDVADEPVTQTAARVAGSSVSAA